MKLDPSQEKALERMQSGYNVFVTGRAGTGKSQIVLEHLKSAFTSCEVTATTGIAAINLQDEFSNKTGKALNASTIYRWAGVDIGPKEGQTNEEFYDELNLNMSPFRMQAFKRIKRTETLLIDEISMLPGRMLNYLEYHFRQLRKNPLPFGGMQIIAVGDFLQLPPVSKSGGYDWAFLSKAWDKAEFYDCCLKVIHRQDDPDFINALNDFREGRIRGETARLLASRTARFPDRNIPRLLTHNTMVNKWNTYQLGCIDHEPEIIFEAEKEGPQHEIDFLLKNMITPEHLHVKRSARVMITRNISEQGELVAANGAVGTIDMIDETAGLVHVTLDNKRSLTIERHPFHFDPMRESSGLVTQFPLRLAYAMTIHKSQGLSLDRALIDIRAAREPGQAYVALSRLRSLQGLWLKDWIKGVFVSPEAINFYKQLN